MSNNNHPHGEKYAAVWTDSALIDRVLEQAESYLKRLRDGSKVTVKIPLLDFISYEYSAKSTGKLGLYFNKEVDLSNNMKITSIPGIYDKIDKSSPFKPFVSQIEENLTLCTTFPKMLREEFRFFLRFSELAPESRAELSNLIALPDSALEKKVLDSRVENEFGGANYMLIERYSSQLADKYPDIRRYLSNLVYREKPAAMSFMGSDYVAYVAGGDPRTTKTMVVCFPEEAKYSIPDAANFNARVLGIVSFDPNPPLFPDFSRFFLRAVSLFIPI